jgi:hypothetical protein
MAEDEYINRIVNKNFTTVKVIKNLTININLLEFFK